MMSRRMHVNVFLFNGLFYASFTVLSSISGDTVSIIKYLLLLDMLLVTIRMLLSMFAVVFTILTLAMWSGLFPQLLML